MSNRDAGTLESELPEGVQFGYAMSVHKAQGSQFAAVMRKHTGRLG
jgi:ATP-dependent exoDNAse (exonuclease V) alpha subunit